MTATDVLEALLAHSWRWETLHELPLLTNVRPRGKPCVWGVGTGGGIGVSQME